MANWAHLEINLDNDGNVEISGYNADPQSVIEGTESWEDLLASLGSKGWELVQVIPNGGTSTYWFKKQG